MACETEGNACNFKEGFDCVKEQVQSTGIRMFYGVRGAYDTICHEAPKLWKEIATKTPELKEKAISTVQEDTIELNEKTRIFYMELYFGIAIILFGLVSGEYIGAFSGKHIFQASWIELGLMFALPFFYWKQPTSSEYDETQTRLSLFRKTFALGFLFGHVFSNRIWLTLPISAVFIPVLVGAFLDPKFKIPIVSARWIVCYAWAIAFISCAILMFLTHTFGLAAMLFLVMQGVIMFGHLHIGYDLMKEGKNEYIEKAQLGYVFSVVLVQLLIAMLIFPSFVNAEAHAHMEL